MPSLSDVLSGFKRASNTTQARTGLSWKTEAVKPVNKTNAQAFNDFNLASGIAPRKITQVFPEPVKVRTNVHQNLINQVKNQNAPKLPFHLHPSQLDKRYIHRTKGEFEHDLDQYGYDPLYGQRDFQSDVDIWTHINEIIHPKHKEQQEYIDIKDEALFSGIQGIYQTRRSKKDIEKIIHDYYQDDIDRIEGKSHQHGFDPVGDLTKSITSILIIAGLAYIVFKFVLPVVRKKL